MANGGGTKVDELFFVLSARTAPLIAGMGAAQGTLRKFSGFLKGPAGPIAAVGALAAAFTAAAVKGTRMAADLDESLREVATLLPETVGQLGGVRDELIQLSEQVPLPPELLTRALYQAVSAGARDTAEALEVVDAASRAAAAGLTDAFTATDAITTALNAYNLSASEAARVSDILFATVERGKTTFAELAPSIGGIVTTAAQAGISLEEVGAAIATLTRRGIDIRVAITSLNRLFLAFIKQSDDAKEAQEALGINLNAARVQSIGLAGALEEINRGTGGLLDNLARTNPNIRELRAALVLASEQGLREFNADLAVTTNSSGKAQEAFREVTGAADAQYELFKNKLNSILLQLGNRTLPFVTRAIERMNRALETDTETLIRQLKEIGEVEAALRLQREETVKNLERDVGSLEERIRSTEQRAAELRRGEGEGGLPFFVSFNQRAAAVALNRRERIREAFADLNDLELEGLSIEEQKRAVSNRRLALIRILQNTQDEIVRVAATDLIKARTDELRTLDRILAQEKARQRVNDQLGETAEQAALLQRQALEELVDPNLLVSPFREAQVQIERIIAGIPVTLPTPEPEAAGDDPLDAEEIEERKAAVRDLVQELQNLEVLGAAPLLGDVTDELQEQVDLMGEAQDRIEEIDLALQVTAADSAAAEALRVQRDRFQLQLEEATEEGRRLVETIIDVAVQAPLMAQAFNLSTQEVEILQQEILEAEDRAEGLANALRRIAEARDVDLGAPDFEPFDFGVELPFDAETREKIAEVREELEALTEQGLEGEDALAAVQAVLDDAGLSFQDVQGTITRLAEAFGISEEKLRLFLGEMEDSDDAGSDFVDTMETIAATADGIIRLADAFGFLDDRLRKVLEGAASTASGIARIASGDVIGGGAQAAGGLISLFSGVFGGGPDPAEEARREALRRNTAALDRLRSDLDRLASAIRGIPGDILEAARRLDEVRVFVTGNLASGRAKGSFADQFEAQLEDLGLTLTDLELIASQTDISIENLSAILRDDFANGSIPAALTEFELLKQAIDELEISRLADSFTAQLDIMQRRLDLFDEEDPAAAVVGLLDLLLQFSDLEEVAPDIAAAIAAAIEDEQITDAERRTLEGILQQLFEGLLGGDLPGVTGGLTIDDFLDAIGQAETGLDRLAEAAEQAEREGPAAESFQVFRGVTELTGRNIVGILTTQDFRLAQIVENTARLVDIQGGEGLRSGFLSPGGVPLPGFGPLVPPTPQELNDALDVEPQGLQIDGGDLTVENIGPIVIEDPSDPQEVADEVLRRIVDDLAPEIERLMGETLVRVQRDTGQPTTRRF